MSLLRNPNYLLKSHTEQGFPPLPCPVCSRPMTIKADSIVSYGTAESRHLWDVGAIAPFECESVFSLFLECKNSECHEKVAVSGKELQQCINSRVSAYETVSVYKILNCLPAIYLFPLPEACEEEVERHMVQSFSHFWNDPSAAGNSLRCAIEALMDFLKIRQKRRTQKGKIQRLTLHDRIEEWKKKNLKNEELSNFLLAIKWIGNAGSHKTTLSKKDLIDAYELAEHVFSEVFDNRTKSLMKLAKLVNQKKGPTK